MFIAPYKLGSASAKALATSLNVKRVDGTKIFKPSDVIINWGNSNLSPRGNPRIINSPNAIKIAANKLSTLNTLKAANIPCVDFTTNKDVALGWVDEGNVVYGRSLLNAHSGEGIHIINELDAFTSCPLYTKGIVRAHEYRVHVFNNKAIDIQKKRRRDNSEASGEIKNLANGWVFCRDNVTAPKALYDAAIAAVNALGLVFGAVDIIYKQRENTIVVLEVNTSPGMERTTIEKYTNALRCYV
jgi:glutathione synthase/RimK-type ligase-like ATP-grasp enzyme